MTLPLEGITVVALEHAIAAPFCSRQLAQIPRRVTVKSCTSCIVATVSGTTKLSRLSSWRSIRLPQPRQNRW